jgi:ATP-dependent Lon protease
MERQKREMYLRQQLLEIRRELGEDFVELDVAQQYQNQVKDRKDLPEEVRKQVILEADRLKQLSSSSAEYGLTKRYIDLLLALPWGEPEHRRLDMKKVEKAIGEHYYGSTKIKDQVLEFLSVRQLSRDPNDLSILCLSGATGTGKASLAKALSHACGWPLVRINGSSLITVEDIKGTLRSDIGAGPGQLIRTFQREGTRDLIIFIEDIEYIIESQDGNALLALMEAVDPRQNQHFLDNYAGIPIDISRVFFIIGVTNLDDIPEPFAHRLEFVELQGYIEREKITIAKRYILPKLYVKHGLTRTELSFNDKALSRIIRFYTMESGLIAFRQQLEKIFRKVARRKAAFEECKHKITDSTVESFLGSPLFIPEKMVAQPEVGVATGLAWTGAGGDLMLIEGLKMRGQGQVIYTGSLGEVMKESIQAAHSYVRAKAEMLGIDHNDFMNFDVHIHFPQGSIPKDGPSAGVAVTLVIASVFAERPIRNDIAMTGEVTLRGKVLPVGGIKEKASAAYRAGIHTIIIPKENEKDLKSLPKEILRKTQFVLIDSVDQLFEEGLIDFTPSTYTLEKLFAEEIEKAKKRSRTKTKAAKKSPATRKRKKPVGKSKKKGS